MERTPYLQVARGAGEGRTASRSRTAPIACSAKAYKAKIAALEKRIKQLEDELAKLKVPLDRKSTGIFTNLRLKAEKDKADAKAKEAAETAQKVRQSGHMSQHSGLRSRRNGSAERHCRRSRSRRLQRPPRPATSDLRGFQGATGWVG